MAPIVSWRAGGRPRNTGMANGIFGACQAAAASAEFDDFTSMEIRNTLHTSRSDVNNHLTVRVKTAVQTANNKHQVAHIYMDVAFVQVQQPNGTTKTVAVYTYKSHILYDLEKND